MPVFAVLTVVVDVQDAERGEGGQEEDPGLHNCSIQCLAAPVPGSGSRGGGE